MPEFELRRGEIYLLKKFSFPHEKNFSNVAKSRPILVLQDNVENKHPRYPYVIVAPLTSQKTDSIYPQDVLLPKGTANLPVTSKVLLGLIVTIEKQALVRRIGKLDDRYVAQVDGVLKRLLGFAKR